MNLRAVVLFLLAFGMALLFAWSFPACASSPDRSIAPKCVRDLPVCLPVDLQLRCEPGLLRSCGTCRCVSPATQAE